MTRHLEPFAGEDDESGGDERWRKLRRLAADAFWSWVNELYAKVQPALTDDAARAQHVDVQLLWCDVMADLQKLPPRSIRNRSLPDWLVPNPSDDEAHDDAGRWRNAVLQEVRGLCRWAVLCAYDETKVRDLVSALEIDYGLLLSDALS